MTIFLVTVIWILILLIFIVIGNNLFYRRENREIKRQCDFYRNKYTDISIKSKKENTINEEDIKRMKKEKKELENFYSYDGSEQG